MINIINILNILNILNYYLIWKIFSIQIRKALYLISVVCVVVFTE